MKVNAVLLWSILQIPSFAQEVKVDESYKSLKGLEKVTVIVSLQPSVEKLGIDKNEIAREVEAKLRKAGLSLIAKPDEQTSLVWVTIEAVADNAGTMYAYNAELRVMDSVISGRNKEVLRAVTWADGTVGLVSLSKAKEASVRAIMGIVEGL